MVEMGRYNRLEIIRRIDAGLLLDGGQFGEILLPRRYLEDGMQQSGELDVFVYRDSEDRAVATTLTPRAQVGECAYLRVVSVNRVGAFLDWGLPKDLLAPFGEQQKTMQKGYSYAVYLYLDAASGRIAASSRLERHLQGDSSLLRPRQPVDCLIYGHSDLGFKAIVDHRFLGQFYSSETFSRLHHGERVQAYVRRVRGDGKIDLSLQLPSPQARERLGQAILRHLRQNHGVSTLTDKSPPDAIYEVFGVSKANYKKALGRLYKQRSIVIGKDRITLAQAED